MANVGDRLKEERTLKGWSQRDLAEVSGTNVDTISGIERGQHEPRPSTLRKLAAALGIQVRDLFEEPVPLGEAPREAGQLAHDHAEMLRDLLDNARKVAQPIIEQDDQTIAAHRQALARMKGGIGVSDSRFVEEESPEQTKLAAEALDLLLQKEEERRQERVRR